MMQRIEPIDAEDALQKDLNAIAKNEGVSLTFFAPPVSATLKPSTCCCTRTGGGMSSHIIDQPIVSFDVWAKDDATAMSLANQAAGIVAALPFTSGTSTQWLITESDVIQTSPYENPDPLHPTLSRCTFLAQLGAHANVVAI